MSLHEFIRHPAAQITDAVWPELPDVTTDDASVFARFFGQAFSFPVLVGDAECAVSGPHAAPDTADAVVWRCQIAEHEFLALLPKNALALLLSAHQLDDNWQQYGPTTAAMVIEHLLAPILQPLETVFDGPLLISATELKELPHRHRQLGFTLKTVDQADIAIGLSADADLLLSLLNAIPGGGADLPGPTLAGTVFDATLRGVAFSISKEDLTATTIGDAFLLEADWSRQQTATMFIAEHLFAHARLSDAGVTLTSALEIKKAKETTMSELDQTTTGALPVTVTVELGRTTLTLADLQEMSAGHVLPFATELPINVALLANGKPFGRGDLVRFDGKIAIRMTEVV
ncbi:FliM/FliN family flagellar motor switch protein [Yoonia sp. 2307UL14-13]|uniref:FliM/FliN family flagellar motor switch protein n=1 Tax=Yoonia sp. 2307UL14-13 TaxID=3126506 RepID=UPI0030A16239